MPSHKANLAQLARIKTKQLAFVWFLAFFVPYTLQAAGQPGLTYQGRILKPNGAPLAGSNVEFRIKIRAPEPSNCLLFEESKTLDLSTTAGVFSLTINDGTGTRIDTTGYGFDQVFSNAPGPHNDFNVDPLSCAPGYSTYAPSVEDGRILAVEFKDETMSTYEPIPAQKINYVPYAFESTRIGGFPSTSLLRVAEADGELGNVSPLSNAMYTELLALLNGTSTKYAGAGSRPGALTVGTSDANNLTLSTNNSAQVTVLANGYVGIGTITPGQKLSVAGTIESTSGGIKFPDGSIQSSNAVMTVVDQMPNGSAATSCTAGSWLTRPLNTVVENTIFGASLASDQITLPAGSYVIEATASANSTGIHQAVFYNITSSTFDAVGTLSNSPGGSGAVTTSTIIGAITIPAPRVFEIRHRCTTSAGFARASPGWGIPALQTILKIRKTN